MINTDTITRARLLLQAVKADNARWYCDKPGCDGLPHEGWPHHHARTSQHPPAGAWTEWLLMTGRGWGKTRTAAELVRDWAKMPGTQIAVVAKKESLVRSICFEHKTSGLLHVIPKTDQARFNASGGSGRFFLQLKNGSTIYGFGAEVPDNLRGFAFDKAWFDEFAAWNKATAQEVYDMMWYDLRESASPQMVISTTPKPLKHVRDLVSKPGVCITRGHTKDNLPNLSAIALEKLERDYGKTRLGRQELAGELIESIEGALWDATMFQDPVFRPDTMPPLEDIVVGVDPAVRSKEGSDMTAFTVAARAEDAPGMFPDHMVHGYILEAVQGHYTPRDAMAKAGELARKYGASRVVLEANNGGEYLPTVLQMVAPGVPWKIVHAQLDKRGRAMPVATLYEQGRIHHYGDAGKFEELESQMVTYTGAAGEKSPDLLDSMVWALTELFLSPVGHGDVIDQRIHAR